MDYMPENEDSLRVFAHKSEKGCKRQDLQPFEFKAYCITDFDTDILFQ